MLTKEIIMELVKKYKDDKDILEIIERDLQSLSEYVAAVYTMECKTPVIYAQYDGTEVRDKISDLDKNRSAAHERAIMGVKRLNRLSEQAGLPVLFQGDVTKRYEIGDFCGTSVYGLFDGRKR